jgi:hypothetical protein
MEKQTGIEYSSKKEMVDITDNVEKPVMHARGDDMHISACSCGAFAQMSRFLKWDSHISVSAK